MYYLKKNDRDFRNKFEIGSIKITPESEYRIGFLNWVETIAEKFNGKFPFHLQIDSTIVQTPHHFTFESIGEIIRSKVIGAAEYFFCITHLRMKEDSLYPSIEIITYNYSENGGIYCTDPYQMVPQIAFEDFIYFTDKQVDSTIANGINPLFFRNFNRRFIEVKNVDGTIQIPFLQKYRDMEFEDKFRHFLTGKDPEE